MAARVSKDVPLAEIILRKYEKPLKLKGRELIRKLCLSVGLLQPGDSRDIIVDIFYVLLKGGELASEEIRDEVIKIRKNTNLPLRGIAASNIRRQLKRLKDLFLIEKISNKYRITEAEKLIHIFEEKIEKFYLRSIVDRVKDYFRMLE